MAEYIEREAAYALSKIICDAIRNREYHPAAFGRFILDRIDDIPTADVQPVRHGRWYRFQKVYIDPQTGMGFARDMYKCDACNVGEEETKMPYCPNCGAKMDKEDTDAKTTD